MGEKGGQVKTLFLQLTDQLVFQSRLFTLSAGLLGSRDLVWGSEGGRGATAGELLSQYRRSGELQLEE